MSPSEGLAYTKFGAELADAMEQVANDPELVGNPEQALEVLGITLPPGAAATMSLDPAELERAAAAIRAGGIPAFWPWVWFIPWVGYAPPRDTPLA